MATYHAYIKRTAVPHCVGSLRAYDMLIIQEALLAANIPPNVVEGICQRSSGNKWEIRLNSTDNCNQFIISSRSLEVRTGVGIVKCPMTSYYDDLRCCRVKALPQDVLQRVLVPYGIFKMAMPEKSRGIFDVYNGNYLVSLKVTDEAKLAEIPDSL